VSVRPNDALGLSQLIQSASKRVSQQAAADSNTTIPHIDVRKITQASARTVEWYRFRLLFDVVQSEPASQEVVAVDVTMAKPEPDTFQMVDVQPAAVEATTSFADSLLFGNLTLNSDQFINDIAMSADTPF